MPRRRKGEPLPVSRLELEGRRVDIFPPKDGVWPLEIYNTEPRERVNVAVKGLATAEREARRILEGFQTLRRMRRSG